ncbi:CLUMA_CG005582, isoform A [Clunio marinus]|uniref:CLUMA_CG005582, isoform A n=1 Tax=Clunio marinus TaxID=568069 RepID=A0A1J1HWT9_9DIPT|nr:CLUMA_CG005582, isoform A [Clunio marinus]
MKICGRLKFNSLEHESTYLTELQLDQHITTHTIYNQKDTEQKKLMSDHKMFGRAEGEIYLKTTNKPSRLVVNE